MFSGNVDLRGVVGRSDKRAGEVFRLSETVKNQFMVALHGSVRPHVCYGRARQRTAMSMNSRLAFAIQRFLSRKSCISVGAAGKGMPMPIASWCFGGSRGWFLCGGVVVLAIERRKGG